MGKVWVLPCISLLLLSTTPAISSINGTRVEVEADAFNVVEYDEQIGTSSAGASITLFAPSLGPPYSSGTAHGSASAGGGSVSASGDVSIFHGIVSAYGGGRAISQASSIDTIRLFGNDSATVRVLITSAGNGIQAGPPVHLAAHWSVLTQTNIGGAEFYGIYGAGNAGSTSTQFNLEVSGGAISVSNYVDARALIDYFSAEGTHHASVSGMAIIAVQSLDQGVKARLDSQIPQVTKIFKDNIGPGAQAFVRSQAWQLETLHEYGVGEAMLHLAAEPHLEPELRLAFLATSQLIDRGTPLVHTLEEYLERLVNDPPDPNFTTIYLPEIPSYTIDYLPGLPSDVSSVSDTILAYQSELAAVMQAMLVAMERESGAIAAHDDLYRQIQQQVFNQHLMRAANVSDQVADAYEEFAIVLDILSGDPIPVTVEDLGTAQTDLISNGLSLDELDTLAFFGLTGSDIQEQVDVLGTLDLTGMEDTTVYDILLADAARYRDFAVMLRSVPEPSSGAVLLILVAGWLRGGKGVKAEKVSGTFFQEGEKRRRRAKKVSGTFLFMWFVEMR